MDLYPIKTIATIFIRKYISGSTYCIIDRYLTLEDIIKNQKYSKK